MRSTPPRRRAQRPPPSDEPGLPLFPILIGVIILGFVIGAGWSLLSSRRGANPSNVAAVSVTQAPDSLPTVTAVPVGPTSIALSPSPEVTTPPAVHTRKPTLAPRVVHTVRVAATPHAPASAMPAASTRPTAVTSRSPVPSPPLPTATTALTSGIRPQAELPPRASPASITVTHRPAASATALASPGSVDVSGDFNELAAAVVRQYLEAIKRRDYPAAYAALGAAPGDSGVSLSETDVVDDHTRIGRVDSHGTGDTATVEVSLQTAAGPYYGEYTVRKNDTGAAVIVAHSLVKP